MRISKRSTVLSLMMFLMNGSIVSSLVDDAKSTLAIVFDTTASMISELRDLKRVTNEIISITNERENSPVGNFVFTPYNDPSFGPTLVTDNSTVLKNTLEGVSLVGGGDCPEMALSGLKEAIKNSLPKSHIYLLSDATAKDVYLVNDIVEMVIQKQCQVVFILTGFCGNRKNENFMVFDKIAQASAGQVFLLHKNDLGKVIAFVRDSFEKDNIDLISKTSPAGYDQKQELSVDNTLNSITLTVAGPYPQLSVCDETGAEITDPKKVNVVVDIPYLKRVNINAPPKGKLSVTHGSAEKHNLKVTGVSPVSIEAGFFFDDVSKISKIPIKGVPNQLMIEAVDKDKKTTFDTVEIVNIAGKVIMEIPLVKIGESNGNILYTTTPQNFPNELFFIAAKGYDNDKNPIKRFGPTAIQEQPPEKVITESKPDIEVKPMVKDFIKSYEFEFGKTAVLSCNVDGVPKPKVSWMLPNGKEISKMNIKQRIHKAEDDSLVIKNLHDSDKGKYSCKAQNTVGDNKFDTILSIGEEPNFEEELNDVTLKLTDDFSVKCLINGNPKPTITWYHNNNVITDIEPIENGSLLTLKKLGNKHRGVYRCVGGNKYGEVEDQFELTLD